jgi:hypothetical protein
MTTKRKVSSKNSIMASNNADFFADFEFIEVVLKKCPKKDIVEFVCEFGIFNFSVFTSFLEVFCL